MINVTIKRDVLSVNSLLVIDDDVELCELLKDYLEPEGFEVVVANISKQGLELALSGEYSLVVLDVMLPDMSGFEVLRQIRASSKIPVIMLTARGDDVDRIVGLEMGADDYLPKPFNPRELVARIRAIQRRYEPANSEDPGSALPERLVVGDMELDKGTRVVSRSGNPVEITSVEFDILEVLMRSAGKVVPRKDLVNDALGRGYSPFDRSVDVHVSSLRRKLGNRQDGLERIKTVRGTGYMFTR